MRAIEDRSLAACTIGAFILLIAISGIEIPTVFAKQPERLASVSDLKNVINSRNVSEVADFFYKLQERPPMDDDPLFLFIRDLWNGKKEGHRDIDWRVLDDPLIRIYMAFYLLQEWDNRAIEVDPNPLVIFIRKSLKSDDSRIVWVALRAAGPVEFNGITSDLYEIARREDKATYRAAVLRLIRKCSAPSRNKLKQLENELRRAENVEFLRNTKRRWHEFNRNYKICPRKCLNCDGS